jgi:mono/diheme cytochrome c family protein
MNVCKPMLGALSGLMLSSMVQAAAPPADAQAAAAPEALPQEAPFALSDAARVETGRKRFSKTCAAYCHGSGGTGGRAPALNERSALTDADLFRTIHDGRRGSDIMPPWGATFNDEQIWELVAYIRSLQSAAPQ